MSVVRGRFGQYTVDAAPISKGGIGAIYRTDDPGYVYKQYFDPTKAPDPDALERLVGVGQDVLVRQGRVPGETPESSINWPIDIVESAAGINGVVLPLIPPALFHEHSGGVRTLDFLVMARGNPPAARGRIALLLRMSELLAYVDLRGLVHGDINGKNLAWSVSPSPIMYLIDCDGMVPQTPAPNHGVAAMGWTDPRLVERAIPAHDQYSDRYALALAMYRGLLLTPGKLDRGADGVWAKPRKIPNRFPDDMRSLILRGLDPLVGEARPSPAEWVSTIRSVYIPDGAFDDERADELDVMSKPPAKPSTPPAPLFSPLPPIPAAPQAGPLWQPTSSPPPSPGPLWQPTSAPPVTTPVLQTSPPAGPQQTPQWQPTPLWQSIPTPPSAPAYGPSGLARSSIDADAKWYILGGLASLLLPVISAIYIAIAFIQMRSVAEGFPGKERAQAWLIVFASVDLASIIYFLLAFT